MVLCLGIFRIPKKLSITKIANYLNFIVSNYPFRNTTNIHIDKHCQRFTRFGDENAINDNLIMPHEWWMVVFYHIRRWIINDRCQLWTNKDHSNQFCVNWMNIVVMFPAEFTLLLACAFGRLRSLHSIFFCLLVKICTIHPFQFSDANRNKKRMNELSGDEWVHNKIRLIFHLEKRKCHHKQC